LNDEDVICAGEDIVFSGPLDGIPCSDNDPDGEIKVILPSNLVKEFGESITIDYFEDQEVD